jgi:hypothetical protein
MCLALQKPAKQNLLLLSVGRTTRPRLSVVLAVKEPSNSSDSGAKPAFLLRPSRDSASFKGAAHYREPAKSVNSFFGISHRIFTEILKSPSKSMLCSDKIF